MTGPDKKLPSERRSGTVDAFLRKVAATPPPKTMGKRGRLLFGMDATASREPSWDIACQIQGEMFAEAGSLGGLDIQLAYYRGFGDFETTAWLGDTAALAGHMTGVACRGGKTQIARLLTHAIGETERSRVSALVFVGDCMEEDVDELCHLAGRLGLLGVPAFMFHEGGDPVAAKTFKEIARLTQGAYCSFDAGSAGQLRELLRAVAAFAAGGRLALEKYGRRAGGGALRLSHQMGRR